MVAGQGPSYPARKPLVVTRHAAHRTHDMGLSLSQVLNCITHPEVDYSQKNHGAEHRVAKRGSIAVAYVEAPELRVILSVLWNTQRAYVRSSEQHPGMSRWREQVACAPVPQEHAPHPPVRRRPQAPHSRQVLS